MEKLALKKQDLAGLLKQGAAEVRTLVKHHNKIRGERDVLLKFARAVEILPALEKSAAVNFPLDMPFSEKALRLAQKSSVELEKLAYMAEHLPETMTDTAKVADDEKYSGDSEMGKLTQFVLNHA